MSDDATRNRRGNKNLNDLAVSLNERYVEELMTNQNHAHYCDPLALKAYFEKTGTTLRDFRGDIGETVLFNCAITPDEDKAVNMMRFLVEKEEISPETEDDLHQTVMYYVAREGKIKLIEYLVENGCSVDHLDIYQQSPLYYAVRENRIEAASRLIDFLGTTEEERVQKLNQADTENETPLFYAVMEGHFEMMQMLISKGADYNKENNSHRTVYDIAKSKSSKLESYLASLGAKKGTKKSRVNKRSGRPANMTTVKQYSLCVYKNGKWVETSIGSPEDMELFEKLKDPDTVNKWLKTTTLPRNLPGNFQWENQAIKILDDLSKNFDFLDTVKFHSPVGDENIVEEEKKEDMDIYKVREKLLNLNYFLVEDWRKDMEEFLSKLKIKNGLDEVLIDGRKFEDLWEEHKMDSYLY